MIEVGWKVRFDTSREVTALGRQAKSGNVVTGIVVMVNEPHEWFLVEYECGGVKLRDSFKFCDIGQVVNICGH